MVHGQRGGIHSCIDGNRAAIRIGAAGTGDGCVGRAGVIIPLHAERPLIRNLVVSHQRGVDRLVELEAECLSGDVVAAL